MSSTIIVILLVVSFLIFLFLGTPVIFVLGGLGVIFGLIFWGPASIITIASSIFLSMTDQILLAIPLFVFMGHMIQHSGIGERFYKTIHCWAGNLRGGLAMGTILSLTAIAAMTPSGVGTLIMGVIALPAMIKRGYNKELAIGTVVAGGMLGMLIVPSILIIIYSMLAGESVGKMFLGALIPGLLLAFLFIIQIGIRCYVNPKLGPPINEEVGWKEKIISVKGIIFPILLIALILGGIYSGTFTPTEASGVGAIGALVAAVIYRNLNMQTIKDSLYGTLRITGMVFWLIVAAKFFGAVFAICGAQKLIAGAFLGLPTSRWLVLIIMQLSLFILCMFVDDFPIMLLTVPLFVPIVKELGFNTLWFGVLFIINMNIAWITPPYGFNLFYARALAPEGMTMGDIYRSVLPFIVCQIVCLILVMLFPQLVLWLPNLIMK